MTGHRLALTTVERTEWLAKVQKGKASAKMIQRTQVLLANEEVTQRQRETAIATTCHLSTRSIERIRKDFCEQGMTFLSRKLSDDGQTTRLRINRNGSGNIASR